VTKARMMAMILYQTNEVSIRFLLVSIQFIFSVKR
jgi:hypothetical protein